MVLVFVVICIAIGLAGALLYLVYLPFKKRLIKAGNLSLRRSRQINIVYILLLVLFAATQTYFSLFPTDNFYLRELKTVTLRKSPPTAEVIKKSSTYPDFHGDYCSCSLIRLSQQDYIKLYRELLNDPRLTKNGKLIRSPEFMKVMGDIKAEQIKYGFQRKILSKEGHYLYIGFINNDQTIVVHRCII